MLNRSAIKTRLCVLLSSILIMLALVQSNQHNHHNHHRYRHDPMLTKPHSTHELGQHIRHQHQRYLGGTLESEILPVYPGYGTHFVYIYVGTPPQRQSVIVDTGSHYTAFPCSGCSQCGQHTDAYWNPDNSSTAVIQVCNGQHCVFTQSYSEGSSWRAIKVTDKVWLGGLSIVDAPGADAYSMNFQFGCQTSETGLFRTQLADGIMGLSMSDDTLPRQLVANGITTTSTFALCFRVGGGIMTLGGVDQSIHLKPGVEYANMTSSNGWYRVELLDVQFAPQKAGERQSLGGAYNDYNAGKGCIIDSGTTDSYFSAILSAKFSSLFLKFTGVHYSSANIALSAEQLSRMPNLIFVMSGDAPNQRIEVEMPWSSYVDSVGAGKYAFRFYLSESSGTVLGANFMNGHNVIFDSERGKIGFAKSNCKYEEYAKVVTASPTMAPTKRSDDPSHGLDVDDDDSTACVPGLVPVTECSARCDNPNNMAYIAEGNQTYVDRCQLQHDTVGPAPVNKVCHMPCNGLSLARGNPSCSDTTWSDCSKKWCEQARIEVIESQSSVTSPDAHMAKQSRRLSEPLFRDHQSQHHGHKIASRESSNSIYGHDLHSFAHTRPLGWAISSRSHAARSLDDSNNAPVCKNRTVTRSCYSGACPVTDGDYLIFIDMHIRIRPSSWSFVHEENFFSAFSNLFKISEGSMQLLNNPNREESTFVKLHFELRLQAKNFNHNTIALHEAAQEISVKVMHPDFKTDLVAALENVSAVVDKIDYSRYSWMIGSDIDIFNAIAVPIGNGHTPFDVPVDVPVKKAESAVTSYANALLAIIAIAGIVGMSVMVILYFRLKQENYALSKERSVGGSLRQMWTKFADAAKRKVRGYGSERGRGTYRGDRSYLQTDNIQMSNFRPDLDDHVEDEEYR